jgi:hypothetical protein
LVVLVGIALPGIVQVLTVGPVEPSWPRPSSESPRPPLTGRALAERLKLRGDQVPRPAVAPLPPPGEDGFDCEMPKVMVRRSRGCDLGLPYPSCRWRLPAPRTAGHLYQVWRNTDDDHLWGRPALVSLALVAAVEYGRLYPGESLAIGDLDAPGPRHETHDDGVDVDLYLPGMMVADNAGAGEYPDNYEHLTPLQRRMLRARVEELARILATCTDGRVRIFYNDPPVNARFRRWYEARGYESPFGPPMQEHNDLHRFHFHVTIPRDMEPLPVAAEDEATSDEPGPAGGAASG